MPWLPRKKHLRPCAEGCQAGHPIGHTATLEKRIDALATDAPALISKHPELARALGLLVSIKGIANTSAIALMGELLLLPLGLSHRQWVKFVGLGSKAFESGKSAHKKARLSKAGNRHLRPALYMPALSAKQHDTRVKAYFRHLVASGKKPLQAACAVMRKLLHAIHGMLKHDKSGRVGRFFCPPFASELFRVGIKALPTLV
jgi:transposase